MEKATQQTVFFVLHHAVGRTKKVQSLRWALRFFKYGS